MTVGARNKSSMTTTRAKEELRPELTRVLTSRELERESDAECNALPYSGQCISSRCIESARAIAARTKPTCGQYTQPVALLMALRLASNNSIRAGHKTIQLPVPKYRSPFLKNSIKCALAAMANESNEWETHDFSGIEEILRNRKQSNRMHKTKKRGRLTRGD